MSPSSRYRPPEGPETLISIKDLSEAQRAQFALELGLEVMQSTERDEQALLDHLIRALEQERARIAADIHDDTIQILSAASLRLQQLRHRLQDPDDLQILDKLEETLTLSLSRLRQLIFDLRPSTLEQGSVADAVRAYLEEMRSDIGIDYQRRGFLPCGDSGNYQRADLPNDPGGAGKRAKAREGQDGPCHVP